jgi:hypothetical protein
MRKIYSSHCQSLRNYEWIIVYSSTFELHMSSFLRFGSLLLLRIKLEFRDYLLSIKQYPAGSIQHCQNIS